MLDRVKGLNVRKANALYTEMIGELNEFCCHFLDKEYGIDFESLGIEFKANGRLSRALGQVVLGLDHNSGEYELERLDLSKNLLRYHEMEEIIDVLKHELVHVAMIVRDEPSEDGHPHFEGELDRLGIGSTGELVRKAPYKLYIHSCGCERKHIQRRNMTNYLCSRCGEILELDNVEVRQPTV